VKFEVAFVPFVALNGSVLFVVVFVLFARSVKLFFVSFCGFIVALLVVFVAFVLLLKPGPDSFLVAF